MAFPKIDRPCAKDWKDTMSTTQAPIDPSKVQDNRFWTLYCNAWRLRCPVCKEGKVFKGWFGMLERCPVCHVRLEREEGYFLGSIYFNYGTTALWTMGMYIFFRFLIGIPDRYLIPCLAAFTILFPLYFFRYARASWMVFDQYWQPRVPPGPGEEG